VKATLCSRNPGKARELERLLPGWALDSLRADEYPPEVGETYYENARGKALFGRAVGDSESWMLGEDSGIEVAALDWGPGVQSARFARGDEVGRLLAALEGTEGAGRRARYVAELVLVAPDGREFRGTGVFDGRIAHAPRGSEGFGYDPIFVPSGEERTVAELGDDWKAAGNSHRARAAAALLEALGTAGVTG
jgi:XTP/dITP diphosphohydrolase